MDDGEIHQFGSPKDVLNNPQTPFVEKLLERTKAIFQQ